MRQSVPLLPRRNFRLLPVVIVGVAVLLAVRLGELSFGVELSPAGPAIAAEGAGADAQKPEKSSASAAEPAGGDGDGEPQEEQQTSGFPVDFTPAEVAVLQDLANRRNELLAFEKELESRDRLLNAAEVRLDKRIGELQQLRDSIEILVREYTDQEKAEIEIVQGYLPATISGDALLAKVKEMAEEVGYQGPQDTGKFMKAWMAKHKGLAEGGEVNAALRSL